MRMFHLTGERPSSSEASSARPPDGAAIDDALWCPLRLAAVARTGLQHEAASGPRDRLAALAARLLGAPSAALVLVEARHDLLPGLHGAGTTLPRGRQVAGRTLAQHVVATRLPVAIDDAWLDAPWVDLARQHGALRAWLGVPVRLDGEVVGALCVHDVRPRAWQHDDVCALEHLAGTLERELSLQVACDDARALAAETAALSRARESQTAVVAHDLRTPLQVVQLSAGLLQGRVAPADQAAVGRLLDAVQSMRRLVDQLMDDHLPDMLSNDARSTRATSLVAAAMSMMGPIAERHGARLSIGVVDDVMLEVDEAEVLRVLANLIGNAIKHGGPGVDVSVEARRAGDMLRLVVSDDGPGMAPDDQAHAFDQGWQGGHGVAAGEGAGLGLSIVQSLVRRHGGAVRLDSLQGRGTRVLVELPLGLLPEDAALAARVDGAVCSTPAPASIG